MTDKNIFDMSRGQDRIVAFIDEAYSAVMTRVVTAHGDPVELDAGDAEQLATVLRTLADRLNLAWDEDEEEELDAGTEPRVADDGGPTHAEPQE